MKRRTSAGQIRWLLNLLGKIVRGLGRHIRRFSFIYGAVFGLILTLCALAAFAWYVVLDYPEPWKATNPSDPRFNPMKFEFTDYTSDQELQEALETLFPVGTEKSYVDKVLGEAGAARIVEYIGKDHFKEKSTDKRYYYIYQNFRSALMD